LGQITLVVLCAGSTLLLMPVVRPTTSQLATPSEFTPFSYWSIKPWFRTEDLLMCSSHLPLVVSQPLQQQRSTRFSGAITGAPSMNGFIKT
jgi:hypothetical protein